MIHRFLQLHMLTSYGPANLNRDDLGQPKTAMLGNAKRLRVSSQSLKRAWRSSDVFQSALGGHVGTRTKTIGTKVVEKILLERGKSAKQAAEWAQAIAGQFGKLKTAEAADEAATEPGKKKGKKAELTSNIETLVFFSAEELAAVESLARSLEEAPTENQLKLLRKQNRSADLALFGRMLADAPDFNVEAAAQVAHAITVHSAEAEDDYFSAVDDLNTRSETGSGHLGELGFGAGVFYLYACIDRALLLENLSEDAALAAKTLRAFVECMATVAPTGKQKSFASNASASYALAELGDAQPRQLSAAYVRPVEGKQVLTDAVKGLESLLAGFDTVYGKRTDRFGFDVSIPGTAREATVDPSALSGDSLLDKLCAFTARGLG